MYYYAMINLDTKVITGFIESAIAADPENEPELILVDSIDETWIHRKRWISETQTWVDVLPNEVHYNHVQNSAMFTHIDANGIKHWLDDFVDGLASGTSSPNFSVDANGVLFVG